MPQRLLSARSEPGFTLFRKTMAPVERNRHMKWKNDYFHTYGYCSESCDIAQLLVANLLYRNVKFSSIDIYRLVVGSSDFVSRQIRVFYPHEVGEPILHCGKRGSLLVIQPRDGC